jgi:hypothetical protein
VKLITHLNIVSKFKSVTGIPPHIPSEMLKACVRARARACVFVCDRVRARVSYPG